MGLNKIQIMKTKIHNYHYRQRWRCENADDKIKTDKRDGQEPYSVGEII